MPGQSYSFNVKEGVASVVSIPTFIPNTTVLTAELVKSHTSLAVTVNNGTIQIIVPSTVATASNSGIDYAVYKNGTRVLYGEIYVIPQPSAPVTSGGVSESTVDTKINAALASLTSQAMLSDAGNWKPSVAYAPGKIVNYQSGRYVTPNGAPANTAFDVTRWIYLGSIGNTI